MHLTVFSPVPTRRLLVAAIALVAAAPSTAQVIEVGDDGAVEVRRGAAVTTIGEVVPIIIESPSRMVRRAEMPAGSAPDGTLGTLFAAAARDFGVDQRLLHAVAWHESRFRQDAVSNKGAVGIMQLMPATARTMGVDPSDIVQNVRGGAALLARLLRQFGGDVRLTLAAYNAGPGSVYRYRGVPPFRETQAYVADIMQRLAS